jgi:hypothetical protein
MCIFLLFPTGIFMLSTLRMQRTLYHGMYVSHCIHIPSHTHIRYMFDCLLQNSIERIV